MNTPAPEVQEQQQVESAQTDPTQFGVLYERYFERVFAFVSRRLPTRQDAEDVTSEVFHQSLASLQSFRWQGTPFIAWLFGIATRLIAKRWQQIGRQPQVTAVVVEIEDDTPDVELQTMLSQFLERLPDDQKLVIVRRFVDQKSIREIAVELCRSDGAIKQLQFRGLENLRSLLGVRHE